MKSQPPESHAARDQSHLQGFSLIELLIATTLVASAGALLSSGLIAANRSAELRIERALTTQLLASQLALLDETVASSANGTIDPAFDDATWSLDVQDGMAPLAALKQVTLTVNLHGHSARLVTYRRQPATP